MNYNSLINLADELHKAYVRSKVRISHIIEEDNLILSRYFSFCETIENPREEMFY